MSNHPNRSRQQQSLAANPAPEEVRALREAAGWTQAQAAAELRTGARSYQRYEDAGEQGRKMHPGLWRMMRCAAAGRLLE